MSESTSDIQWFDERPERHYRVTPTHVVRRVNGDVFLRTPLKRPFKPNLSERAAKFLWWEAAYPHLSQHERLRLAQS